MLGKASGREEIKGLLFDVDDTLFNRRRLFASFASHYLVDILQITDDDERRSILAEMAVIDGNGYGSKKELIESLLTLYPPPTNSTYDSAQAYDEFFSQSTLDPEAISLLGFLDKQRIPYGIVTNGTIRQVEKVEKLGLGGLTDCIFVSSTFGREKPDPSIFIAAATCLRIEPRHILFVGDSPLNDIAGAQKVGMLTARLNNGQPWPATLRHLRPTHEINSLDDLYNILA